MERPCLTFVSGDIGAAQAQLPVIQALQGKNMDLQVWCDTDGMAKTVFEKNAVSFTTPKPQDVARQSRDTIFVTGMSATASALERQILKTTNVRVFVLTDGYFNHGLPIWEETIRQAENRFTMLAIDAAHEIAIKRAYPHVPVQVTGQPAFDAALRMIPDRAKIRHETRKRLQIREDERLLLWWSTGVAEMADEDLLMMEAVLSAFENPDKPTILLPRFHPKLDKTRGPYYISHLLESYFPEHYPCWNGKEPINSLLTHTYVYTRKVYDVPSEHLCLAADAILSITCTEDIKSTLMGGPPVVHLLGPTVRAWLESQLHLASPYLPDVASGSALAAYAPDAVGSVVRYALRYDVQGRLRQGWRAPTQPSSEEVIAAILNKNIRGLL